jgi:hypothetical protein
VVIRHTIKRVEYNDLYVVPINELFRQVRVTTPQHLTATILTKMELKQHQSSLAAIMEFTLIQDMHNRKVSNW